MNGMKAYQTFLTESEVEALARIEAALSVERGTGRPSPSGLRNVKRSLALCVHIADWLLATGIPVPAHVLERDNGAGHE